MSDEKPLDQAKFDAILSRLLNSKPITKAEVSARIKAERAAKKAAKPVKHSPENGQRRTKTQ
jgi:hypothetical protein